jgi:hypothetical protein
MSQYDQCSTNSICGCFHTIDNNNNNNNRGICGFLWLTCSEFVSCGSPNHMCYEPDHICVHHPRCHDHPVCYPLSKANEQICPLIISKIENIYLYGSSVFFSTVLIEVKYQTDNFFNINFSLSK